MMDKFLPIGFIDGIAGCGTENGERRCFRCLCIPAIAVDTCRTGDEEIGICRWKDSVREVEETLMKKCQKKNGESPTTG